MGLGLGGSTPGDSRMWLGEDILSQSFLNQLVDQTYMNGVLVDGLEGRVQIEQLEVWAYSNNKQRQLFKSKTER